MAHLGGQFFVWALVSTEACLRVGEKGREHLGEGEGVPTINNIIERGGVKITGERGTHRGGTMWQKGG